MKRLFILLLALWVFLSSCTDATDKGVDSLLGNNSSATQFDTTTESERLTSDSTGGTTEEPDWEEETWDVEVETEPEIEFNPDDTDDGAWETEFETEGDGNETEWVEPPYYKVDGYLYRIDVGPYLSYIAPKKAEEYLILANRNHYLSSSYYPSDLVRTKANYDKKLRKAAAYALDAMFLEMKALGVCDTKPQSAFRSYTTQVSVYDSYLKKERKRHPTYTEEQIVALVQTYSSPPGASDHQTGLAVDFSPIAASFSKTKAFQYLKKNAHKFGFILRFPQGKTDITGYMYESWHWRFVGREAATEIYERGLTLEEYLEELYGGIIPPETSAPDTSIPELGDGEGDVPETSTSASSDDESEAPETSLSDSTDGDSSPDDSTEGELPSDTDIDTDSQPSDTDTDTKPPDTAPEESSFESSDTEDPATEDSGTESASSNETGDSPTKPPETPADDSEENDVPSDTISDVSDVADTTQGTWPDDVNT